jgi:acetyl esterase/lipase
VSDLFSTVDATRNVEYGASVPFGASAPAALRLDLFAPAGDTASARPVVLLIHGGGFFTGNRNDANIVDFATRLARRGFVTASLSYRLRTEAQVTADPAGTIRDAVDDAKAAVRWMRANAATYRIDPTRIAIGGASAGGFTALGATYLEGEGNSGTPGESSSVRAVISFWGGMLDANQIEAGEAPMLLIHGTNDLTVPYTQATTIRDRAQAVGVPVDLRTMTGAGHTFWTPVADYVNWASAFLRQHLALP